MFISQTLSGLDREIINQLRVYVFGFGLAYGIELLGLKALIGGNDEAIRLYQMFKDPQSNPKQKECSFMTLDLRLRFRFLGYLYSFRLCDTQMNSSRRISNSLTTNQEFGFKQYCHV